MLRKTMTSRTIRRKPQWIAIFTALILCIIYTQHPYAQTSTAELISLEGQETTYDQLIQSKSIFIYTPSRNAAESTREWVKVLQPLADNDGIIIRDILAVSVPFFIDQKTVLKKARKKIPKKYWDQTWVNINGEIEEVLNAGAHRQDAIVMVVDMEGNVVSRFMGDPDTGKLDDIRRTLANL